MADHRGKMGEDKAAEVSPFDTSARLSDAIVPCVRAQDGRRPLGFAVVAKSYSVHWTV